MVAHVCGSSVCETQRNTRAKLGCVNKSCSIELKIGGESALSLFTYHKLISFVFIIVQEEIQILSHL